MDANTLVTLLLVIVTVFLTCYTKKLGKITIYDKRYKCYDSLMNFIKNIAQFKKEQALTIVLVKLKSHINENNGNLNDVYNHLYGNAYIDLKFQAEAAHFLFNKDINNFFETILKKAHELDENIYDYLISDNHHKSDFEESIKYFSNLQLDNIRKKFNCYLKI